jgi:curli production assembly/transport component CsgE
MQVTLKNGLAGVALIFTIIFGSLATQAAESKLNGLLLNETRTRFGNEFYRHFCDAWGEPRIDFLYTVVVREIPDPRWGSIFSVDINGQEVYRKTIQPRSSQAWKEAGEAVSRARSALLELMHNEKSGGSEDLMGNGY